jgi:putative flavoprotein involved in K+ transport
VDAHSIETVVIGAGQAGLATGYHLARRGRPFVILDADARVGDQWRRRWDSLRLFTPAAYDGLPGWRFPAPSHSFPTKDEMADYLEAYARRFDLPVRPATRVTRLSRSGGRLLVEAGPLRYEADNVVVAMAGYQGRRVPPFAAGLDPRVVQLHSSEYRNPDQLAEGDVLIAGAGNSGAEIAVELAGVRRVWLAGRDVGHIPFRIEGLAARLFLARLVLRVAFHRVLTVRTPIGRRMRRKMVGRGGPLIRVKPADLDAAGVERTPGVAGVRDGLPLLEDGRVLPVRNVVWCTGFDPALAWIDLPGFDGGEPPQVRGVVEGEPGLFFVGRFFQTSPSSVMVHGVGRDAAHVVRLIAARARDSRREPAAGAAVLVAGA